MRQGRYQEPRIGRDSGVGSGRLLWTGCLLLSLLSGAVALIYELLWTRRFATIFGATAPAASVTISALFLGLGVGSAMIGARSTRWRRCLRSYGLVEIGVGLSALSVDWLLGFYETSYPLVHASLIGHPTIALGAKCGFAGLALFVPAFLMGGTLALLSQASIRSPESTGTAASALYGANTLGATLGAFSVPFFWLPRLGVQASYRIAVLGSLVIGAMALLLDFQQAASTSENGSKVVASPPPGSASRKGKVSSPSRPRRLLVERLPALAFLSGFLTLGLEVLWMRMLAQVHENSIYSFAIVLSIFLVGLSVGAFLARAALARRIDARAALGLAWLLGGWLVLLSPALFYWLSGGLGYASQLGPPALVTVGLALATMLSPTLLAAMALPLVLHLTAQARPQAAGPMVGRLLAFNTAGAAMGPLVVTYLGFPSIGLWGGIAACGLAMAALGEGTLTAARVARRSLRRALALAAIILTILLANPFLLPRVKIDHRDGERLVHVEEGSHGIVAVVENSFSRWMVLNNFYTLGGTGSAIEERQQAQIPLLLHESPRRVAFLGMGTGISAGGALLPPVQRVVALEMVPEVIRAARDFFDTANRGLLKDPRVEVIREDARIHLRATADKFDVIVGDLVVPWRSGESALFTPGTLPDGARLVGSRGTLLPVAPDVSAFRAPIPNCGGHLSGCFSADHFVARGPFPEDPGLGPGGPYRRRALGPQPDRRADRVPQWLAWTKQPHPGRAWRDMDFFGGTLARLRSRFRRCATKPGEQALDRVAQSLPDLG